MKRVELQPQYALALQTIVGIHLYLYLNTTVWRFNSKVTLEALHWAEAARTIFRLSIFTTDIQWH